MAENGPLAGVRVLDASTMIAAPTTAAMLADFGADVVKLERPGPGDHARRYGAQKNGVGLYWKALGRNKKSVALRSARRRGAGAAAAMAAAVRHLHRELSARNARALEPRTRPSARGRAAPRRAAHDRVRAGRPVPRPRRIRHARRGDDRRRRGVGLRRPAAAAAGVSARGRDGGPGRGGRGLRGVRAAASYRRRRGDRLRDLRVGDEARRVADHRVRRERHASSASGQPHGRHGAARRVPVRATARYVALSGSTQEVAGRVLRTIGGEALANDPRFRTNADRVANGEALDALIEAFCASRTRDEVDRRAQPRRRRGRPARIDRLGVRQPADRGARLARDARGPRPGRGRHQQRVPALRAGRRAAAAIRAARWSAPIRPTCSDGSWGSTRRSCAASTRRARSPSRATGTEPVRSRSIRAIASQTVLV